MTHHHLHLISFLSILLLISGLVVVPMGQTLQTFIDCLDVLIFFSPCIEFINGHIANGNPAWNCCSGVRELNKLARGSVHQVQRICQCIELVALIVNDPPFLPTRINDLPMKCHTHLSFPISVKKNCSVYVN
ncbi:Non-specific lipid-transfer protein 13 [Euphorbia peplus]|nr:Non-specific lipid-transfer protein 13 [Euphorbia peplus]